MERLQNSAHPEESYARLLTACHLELGALAYLSLRDESLGQTTYGVSANIDPTSSWRERVNRASTIRNYFDKIFIDIAMVTKQTVVESPTGQQVTHYFLAPFGKQVQGAAFYLVSEVIRINEQSGRDLSLQHMLTPKAGGTRKNDEEVEKLPASRRGPYHRARIIEILSDIPPGQTTNPKAISAKIPMFDQTAVSPHIEDLKVAGLAEGNGIRPETEGRFLYKKIEGVKMPPNSGISVNEVSKDMQSLIYGQILTGLEADSQAPFNSADLFYKLYERHCRERSEKGRKPVTENVFRQNVSRILSTLRKSGYFTGEFFGAEQEAWAKLTPTGLEVAQVLRNVRAAIQYPDISEDMYQLYQAKFDEFRRLHARRLLELQKMYGHQPKSAEERMTQLLRILRDNPEGLRSMTLQRALGVYSGEYTQRLIKEGMLQQEWETSKGKISPGNHGPGSVYSLTEKAKNCFIKLPDATYVDLIEVCK